MRRGPHCAAKLRETAQAASRSPLAREGSAHAAGWRKTQERAHDFTTRLPRIRARAALISAFPPGAHRTDGPILMIVSPTVRLLCSLLLSGVALSAAPRPNTFSTAGFSANPAPRSPVVGADGGIAFAFRAPGAREVVLSFGEWSPRREALTRDANGWWTGRVESVAPGIYEYVFLVDGTPAIDPLNARIKAGTVVYSSTVEVPGTPPRFDEIQNVPQGVEHILRYRSSSQNRFQTLHVHLPAVYASEPARRFPVLYLRHGGGDDDHSWMQDGRAGVILDNLVATGAADPMIIVTTHGMTDGTWAAGSSREGMQLLEDELLHDVIPLIE